MDLRLKTHHVVTHVKTYFDWQATTLKAKLVRKIFVFCRSTKNQANCIATRILCFLEIK